MRPWVPVAALALALSPLLVVRPVLVKGRSMEPFAREGVWRLGLRAWAAGAPAAGEVWLLDTRDGDMLKRVVGLPGQTLEQRDGILWRDSRRLDEPYVRRLDESGGGPWACGGGYFVAGDNRRESRDSRAFGPLPRAAFIARIL